MSAGMSNHNGTALGDALRAYMSAPNRLAYGERKIVVMSPKVGQKSYGTEKRFLCPHPQATLVGESWWTPAPDGCPVTTIQPPRVNIGLSGEHPVKDSMVSWSTIDSRNLDEKINSQALGPNDHPFIGNVAGKNLHISDNDGKRKELKALVTVKAPLKVHAGPNGWGHTKGMLTDISNAEIIGTFESKEIKVISKPSKKKSNSKSTERELVTSCAVAKSRSHHSARLNHCSVQPRQVADNLDTISFRGSGCHPDPGIRWQARQRRSTARHAQHVLLLPWLCCLGIRLGVVHHLACRPDKAARSRPYRSAPPRLAGRAGQCHPPRPGSGHPIQLARDTSVTPNRRLFPHAHHPSNRARRRCRRYGRHVD
jgi:hypothetical protein